MSETSKPILDSLTIRALVGVVIGFVVTKFGLPFDSAVLSEALVEVTGEVIQLVGVVTAAYGRVRATKTLTVG